MTQSTRPEGYYWVKLHGLWEIGQWIADQPYWKIPHFAFVSDIDLQEIGHRIPSNEELALMLESVQEYIDTASDVVVKKIERMMEIIKKYPKQ